MKHPQQIVLRFQLLALLLVLLLSSCTKPQINLFADYKEIPVIYGVLDVNADTNFIKITRAFGSTNEDPIDPMEVALIYDSCNYPGKLNAYIEELKSSQGQPYQSTGRKILLDTITIRNKQTGTFYAPKQKLYYTAERLRRNTKTEKYQYKLTVVLPDRVLVSTTDIVGSGAFRVKSTAANFSLAYFGIDRPLEFYPADNACSYDVTMSFTFKEQRTPDGDSVPRTMYWDLGTYTNFDLSYHIVDDYYQIAYRPERFYKQLIAFLGADTAIAGLSRFIGDYPIEITIAAAGEELSHYIDWSSVGNYGTQGGNDFTLIEGGTGVFSSRMTAKRRVRLAGTTVPELVAHRNWGFKFSGGD